MYQKFLVAFALVMSLFLIPQISMAAEAMTLTSDGSEFKGVYDWVIGALKGYLGKTLVAIFFVVGLIFGLKEGDWTSGLGFILLAIVISLVPVLIEAFLPSTTT